MECGDSVEASKLCEENEIQSDGSWEDLDSDDCQDLPKTTPKDLPKQTLDTLPKLKGSKRAAPKIKAFSGSKASRFEQINEAAQTFRPQGRVLAVIECPNRTKEQMITLTTLKPASGSKKENGKKKNKAEDAVHVLAVPANTKLPWMQLSSLPAEYHEDVREKRKIGQRYYVAKLTGWTE